MLETVHATHVIAHISDTHLLGGARKLFSRVDVAQNLTRVLDRLRSGDQQIDALVFTGDLADIAEVDAYRWLRGQVEPAAAELGAELVWVKTGSLLRKMNRSLRRLRRLLSRV
jgi:3',5'-cyclic AMP phosphodiesterase CpdA